MSTGERKMYNEEQKLSFIRQQTTSLTTSRFCESVFKAVAPYEEKWEADICTRSSSELRPVVELFSGTREKSGYRKIVVLKSYLKWCIMNGVPNAVNGLSDVKVAGLGKVRSMTVKSPAHLQKCLNDICDPESENTVDNIYRCYYWLAYGGIPEEELLSVKTSEVDFENMEVNHAGITIPIYHEAIPAFRNCVNLDHFIYKHPNYSKDIVRFRAEGDTLIRGIKSASSTLSVRAALSRMATEAFKSGRTSVRLSFQRVWISGMFYRMREREELGFPVDFMPVAQAFCEGREYKLDKTSKTQEGKVREIAADYLKDYERWKAANALL